MGLKRVQPKDCRKKRQSVGSGAYGYILSFGTYVKGIEPEHIRQIVKERTGKIHDYYK